MLMIKFDIITDKSHAEQNIKQGNQRFFCKKKPNFKNNG